MVEHLKLGQEGAFVDISGSDDDETLASYPSLLPTDVKSETDATSETAKPEPELSTKPAAVNVKAMSSGDVMVVYDAKGNEIKAVFLEEKKEKAQVVKPAASSKENTNINASSKKKVPDNSSNNTKVSRGKKAKEVRALLQHLLPHLLQHPPPCAHLLVACAG